MAPTYAVPGLLRVFHFVLPFCYRGRDIVKKIQVTQSMIVIIQDHLTKNDAQSSEIHQQRERKR